MLQRCLYTRLDMETSGGDETPADAAAQGAPNLQNTGSPFRRSLVLRLFCFNAPCQFTPLLNLRSLILGLTPLGWLRTTTLPTVYETHGAEQDWEDACSLQSTSRTVRSQFASDHAVCVHLFNFFVLPTNATMTHPVEKKKLTPGRIIAAVIFTIVIV
jgi:hypothetical protein